MANSNIIATDKTVVPATSRAYRELSIASGQIALSGRPTQDRVFTLSANIPKAGSHIPFGLLIAADGVSSTSRAGLAADIAVESVSRLVTKQVLMPVLARRGIGCRQASIHETLRSAVSEANRKVLSLSAAPRATAGTTLTVLLIMGSAAHLIHIGDSRAYVIEDGVIRQISTDHSISARLQSIGQPGSDDNRHVLYKALGVHADIEPQVASFHLSHIQGFLVCTDGFWSAATSESMARAVSEHNTARSLCDCLLALPEESLADDASIIVGLFQEAAGSERSWT